MAMYEINQLRAMANGRWPDIIRSFSGGNEYVDMALKATSSTKQFPCPVHMDGKTRFRFARDFASTGAAWTTCCGNHSSGFNTLMWLNNWTFPETVQAVGGYLNGQAVNFDPREARILQEKANAEREAETISRRQNLARVWGQTVSMTNHAARPAWLYLASRGLKTRVLSPFMRFHPDLPYYDGDGTRKGVYPAILVKFITADGLRCTTIHRHYITNEGAKAPFEETKKMMSIPHDRQIRGSAMRLDEPGEDLAVGEGLETMLSVRTTYPTLPVWATSGASFLAHMDFPAGLKRLHVFADNDRNQVGQDAAAAVVRRARAAGIDAQAYMPGIAIPDHAKGVDWNDALVQYGPGAFPDLARHIQKKAA